jgi:hypothetical protein
MADFPTGIRLDYQLAPPPPMAGLIIAPDLLERLLVAFAD